jgi:hypothetical protein
MKTLLCLFAMMLCLARAEASDLRLVGDLTWNVTDPQCSFRLKGKLQNLGLPSGSLRLALWGNPFPNQPSGTLVAQFPIGQLGSNSQIKNFTFKTTATIPISNGEVFYTITVMELTTAGWRNQIAVQTGSRTMFQGQFADQQKWTPPRKRLVDPPAKLKKGDLVLLKEKAMGNLNRFPGGWRQRYKLDVVAKKVIKYETRNLDETVNFTYRVLKRKYLGKRANVGYLTIEYTGLNNIKFTEKLYLFFHGPKRGTYQSSVKGALWNESSNPWTTWGHFKLK